MPSWSLQSPDPGECKGQYSWHCYLAFVKGATLYVTVLTCRRHFWMWWQLSPPLFKVQSEKFLSMGKVRICARTSPRTLLGELTVVLQAPAAPREPYSYSWPFGPRATAMRALHVPSEVTTIFSCKVATLAFIMAALHSRCWHYIFVLSLLLSSSPLFFFFLT